MRWCITLIWIKTLSIIHSEPIIMESCSRTSPPIPHTTDCSRYYECMYGQWKLQQCKSGLLFDSTARKCLYYERVSCAVGAMTGSLAGRHNFGLKLGSMQTTVAAQDRSLQENHSKTTVFWITCFINKVATHTTFNVYNIPGDSYTFTKDGDRPDVPEKHMIPWARENADKYGKIIIPYSEANKPTCFDTYPSIANSTLHPTWPFTTTALRPTWPLTTSTLRPTWPPTTPTLRPTWPPTAATSRPTWAPTTPSSSPTWTPTTATPRSTWPPTTPTYRPYTTLRPTTISEDGLPENCGRTWNKYIQFKVSEGKHTSIESVPWQVGLLVEATREHLCGGSIVTIRHVLSAAHCLYNIDTWSLRTANDIIVRVGDYDKMKTEINEADLSVYELYPHAKYNRYHRRNDIALLTVKFDIQMSTRVLPICIPQNVEESKYAPGRKCFISGWGVTKYGGTETSRFLQGADIQLVEQQQCSAIYRENPGIEIGRGMMCAGDLENGGVDTCQGDSGGPLACTDDSRVYLYGITSWGSKCGQAHYPGVYTRVAEYHNWIVKTIKLSNLKLGFTDADDII